MSADGLELLTVGRVGVDIYPQQNGPLKDVSTFAKYLGGTATNVAVGAARLGRRTAVLTKVGPDGFGEFVREALVGFGVDPSYVGTAEGLLTPVVFCELDPPEDPGLVFYRQPIAPDLTIGDDDVPWDLVRDVPVFWVTGTGASVEPSRTSQLAMLKHRGRPEAGSGRHTVLDLDWRPMFWSSPEQASAEYDAMLDHVTVAVGNRAEVEVAVGTSDPHEAATGCSTAASSWPWSRWAARACSSPPPSGRDVVAPHPVEVVCGLGAGDAFGGALVHGLLAGWDPVKIAGYANAAGAIVASRLACADAMPTLDELRGPRRSSRRTQHERRRRTDQGPARSEHLRRRLAPPARAPGDRPRCRRRGLRRPPPSEGLPLRPRHGLPGRRRPPRARCPRARAASRWRWPTVARCSPGWSRRLQHPDVDGVLGTPDIVEELLLLGALEDKVVIGSMNRGGLDGATWTMDDRFTGYDAASIAACRPRGRQDAAPHRRQRRRHGHHDRGLRQGGQRAGRPWARRDGRAAALRARRRRHAVPAQGRARASPARSRSRRASAPPVPTPG